MLDVWMKKTQFGKLEAFDDESREELAKIKNGEQVRVKISRPRNIKFHNKYFALLALVFENQDKYESREEFRHEVTMRAGYYDTHHHLSGAVSYHPKSISFANMDESTFADLYDRTIQILIDNFLPGTDRAELEQELQGFF